MPICSSTLSDGRQCRYNATHEHESQHLCGIHKKLIVCRIKQALEELVQQHISHKQACRLSKASRQRVKDAQARLLAAQELVRMEELALAHETEEFEEVNAKIFIEFGKINAARNRLQEIDGRPWWPFVRAVEAAELAVRQIH